MACAANITDSMRNATASPVANPMAASASIQPDTCNMLPGMESSTGQREYIPNVRIIASVILAALGPACRPGSGRNTKTPEIRASTSRNPYNTDVGMAGLACITANAHSAKGRQTLRSNRPKVASASTASTAENQTGTQPGAEWC